MIQSITLRLVGQGLAHVLSDVLRPSSQTGFGGTLIGSYLGLFTNWTGYDPRNATLAGITEPVYGGYARVALTFGAEGWDATNHPEVLAGSQSFQPSNSSASSTIQGAFLADSLTGGNLLAAGILGTSKTMSTPEDVINLLVRVAIPAADAPSWGEIVATT